MGRTLIAVIVCLATATLSGCYRPNPTGGEQTLRVPAGGSATVILVTPSPTASATPTATPSATKELQYIRDAREMPKATPTATRSSRSPVRKAAGSAPPPRTRVLEAPQASAGVVGITFDNLMFPLEKDQPFTPDLLTPEVRALFGKRIKIRGFIHPSCPFQDGVTNFILVRDDQGCCFGPGALLYDCVIVDMVPGKTTKFSTRPVAVEGVLSFKEYKSGGGRHEAIFHLAADAVE